ncbi:uncharacterized protein Z520_11831 [Fonsecaea multimorphosa CBS 102226]|uniref:Uncharacterized protein n=1 Tax=Fonsecaea multimorphosa CBS 102226 TaxID=1442371 RepID=A0A0D2I5H0_9EURO|nr:uncharacterized protein Z520_11831 [Fonsecaea multimorphosa CBS 102226]KIX92511.1 hypothetical protein Z520_11831 [Fonsecaea multimorphosa CBS 102226]
MTDFIELSSPYGSSPYGSGNKSHGRTSIRTLGSLHRKSGSGQYNPILTPQEEQSSDVFTRRVDKLPSTTTLPPSRIGKFGTDLLVEIIVCTFAVLVSVPFMWLAITMAHFDGQRVTEAKTNYIKQATSTASTLFTILFAAVLGTALKRFATWRLEKGIKLGLLEQIMQSRTFFAAVTTQVAFPAINFTALILLASWVFFTARITSSPTSGQYRSGLHNKFRYISSILGPTTTKNGTMDLFGGVKIPWLQNNLDKDADGWTTLSRADMTEGSFSALVGVPIASLANQNSSFVIETTYMNLDCDKPQDQKEININFNVTSGNGTFLGPNTTVSSVDGVGGIYPVWQVAMNQFVSDDYYFYGYPEQLVNVTDANLPQATFLFQTRGPWVAKCQINQVYLESNISCQSVPDSELPVCAVAAQRNSPNKHAPSTVTTLSFPSTFSYLAQTWILATDPLLSSGYSSLAEYYLQNTSAAFILSGNEREYADYSDVTALQFSQRLGQLLNTWVLSSQVSADTMQYGLNHKNTTAFYKEGFDIYVVSWAWLGVYCASIGVMQIAAFCTIWCAYHTTIPDVLSFCSSLTRDSTYFDFAKGGSALDGIVRARMLRDVEVKLGEVVGQQTNDGFRNDFVNDIGNRPGERMAALAVAPPEYLRNPRRGMLYA